MPALCLAVRGRRPRGLPHELRASCLPLLPLGRAKPSPRFLLLGVLPDLVCGLVLPCPPHTCQCPGLSSPGASVPHVASQAPADDSLSIFGPAAPGARAWRSRRSLGVFTWTPRARQSQHVPYNSSSYQHAFLCSFLCFLSRFSSTSCALPDWASLCPSAAYPAQVMSSALNLYDSIQMWKNSFVMLTLEGGQESAIT